MPTTFTINDFPTICDELAATDPELHSIIQSYGYPPFWSRPNIYESLVWFILEQQVSLASAKAALEKLRAKVGVVTPESVAPLTDEELRACYFSRQKTSYLRCLTNAVLTRHLDIAGLAALSDDEIRSTLTKLKGIGNWTVDVYLIMALHRADHFPIGDIAAVNALKALKDLPKSTPRQAVLDIAETWRPYRSVATMLLWHCYLSSRVSRVKSTVK